MKRKGGKLLLAIKIRQKKYVLFTKKWAKVRTFRPCILDMAYGVFGRVNKMYRNDREIVVSWSKCSNLVSTKHKWFFDKKCLGFWISNLHAQGYRTVSKIQGVPVHVLICWSDECITTSTATDERDWGDNEEGCNIFLAGGSSPRVQPFNVLSTTFCSCSVLLQSLFFLRCTHLSISPGLCWIFLILLKLLRLK